MISIEYILLGGSILLFLSVIASKASARLGVPALVLFLVIGMLAGSDGPGGIYFDDPWLAQSLGVVALAFILFAGGLDTNWQSVRQVFWSGIALSTLGIVITALLVAWFATVVLDFSLFEGLLLGAVVSSTDAAAVFAILRSRNVSLKGRLQPLLELESGSNDPMAVYLTLGFIGLLSNPTASIVDLIPMFIHQMTLGVAVGYAMGKAMVLIVNRLKLEYDGLYPVLTLSLVLLTYGATASMGGNGFLAVYLSGLLMGNSDFIHKKSLMHFHDGLAWLMQIAMFLTLGLQVFPSRLIPIIGVGLLVSIFLIFVARPLSVFVALLLAKMNLKEKIMVSWVGLRGAVPVILATFPLLAGVPKADMIFNIVFFIVLTSVLLQGTMIPQVAKWLGLAAPVPEKPNYPLEFATTSRIPTELVEVKIPDSSTVVGKQLVELGLPKGVLVMLIHRNNVSIVPGGGTILKAGDTLVVLAQQEDIPQVRSMMGS
jgi:cell volume regulation protein A